YLRVGQEINFDGNFVVKTRNGASFKTLFKTEIVKPSLLHRLSIFRPETFEMIIRDMDGREVMHLKQLPGQQCTVTDRQGGALGKLGFDRCKESKVSLCRFTYDFLCKLQLHRCRDATTDLIRHLKLTSFTFDARNAAIFGL